MISLNLNTPEELAEAIYLSELSIQVMEGMAHRMISWEHLSYEAKLFKVKAAIRLLALYKASV